MKKFILFLVFSFTIFQVNAQRYKKMMDDNSINFYDVCKEAEAYFSRINKDKKGSGYKPFLAWKAENEAKYFPSGNRLVDHNAPINAYVRIKNQQVSSAGSDTKQALKLFVNSGWKNIGPDTMGLITGHYAPGMGRVEDLAVNKSNPNQIYFSSRSGGLWRTNNGGTSWTQSTDFLPATGVTTFDVKPTHFDSVLIAVNNSRNNYAYGIYRTTNGGATFSPTNFVAANLQSGGLGTNFRIYCLKYHPSIPNLVFVATSAGLYRSSNDLNTFTLINTSLTIRDLEFHATNANILYAFSDNSAHANTILKSTDAGLTFLSSPTFTGNLGRDLEISVSPVCPACVYVFSDSGIWVSYNEAATFIKRTTPSLLGITINHAMVSDVDTSKIIIGNIDADASANGGLTFQVSSKWSLGESIHGAGTYQDKYNSSQNYIHADIRRLKCINGVFYTGTDGFLAKSTDNGATWVNLNTNTNIRENYLISVAQSNNKRTMAGSQDNGLSCLTENGWMEIYGADGMDNAIHPLNPNYMYGSIQAGSRLRWTDGGFVRNGGGLPSGYPGWWEAPLVLDPNDQMTLYSFNNKVLKTTNFGDSWTEISDPFAGGVINEAAIAYNNSRIIAASKDDNIQLSRDAGLTWASIKANLPTLTITDITFDPSRDSTIVVVYADYNNSGKKVYLSHNLGSSWINITNNLTDMPLRAVAIDHSRDRNIYLGAEVGVYTRKMSDTTWTLYNLDLPNVTITDLDINFGANTIQAATWGRGLWEYNLEGRKNFPAITSTFITNPPTNQYPRTTKLQSVTSQIIYTGSTLSNAYVLWSWDSAVWNPNNIIPMSLVSGNNYKTNAPLPDGIVGRKMFFKVVAVGANQDTSETYKFQYTLKSNDPCIATGNQTAGSLFIASYSCGSMTNSNSGNTGYSYFSNKPIVLNQGNTYTSNATFNTSTSTNDLTVWIDYNNDKIFSNSERVVTDLNTGVMGSGTFTVPFTTVTDTVHMRVRLSQFTADTTACGAKWGEVEDYPVILQAPTALTVFKTDVSCFGGNNGTINASLAGATITINGAAPANNYPAGTYTVTAIANTTGTSTTSIVMINQAAVIPTPIVTVVNNCNGTSTLSTNATGSLVWNTGATTPSITVNNAGFYYVAKTLNGCQSLNGYGTAQPKTTPATPTLAVQNACGNSIISINPVCTTTTTSEGAIWNFNTSSPSSIPLTNVSVSPISQGNNFGTTSLFSSSNSSAGYTGASGGNSAAITAIAGALNINTSSYFEFILTPAAGTTFSLNNISFGSRVTTLGYGPQTYTLRSSLDGFTSDLATGSNSTSWALKSHTILNNSSSAPVVYRLYGWNVASTATVTASQVSWRIDDLTLGLSVAKATCAYPPGTYLWSTGASTHSIAVTAPATYLFNTTINGCTSANAFANANPVIISTPIVSVVNNCDGTSILSTTVTGNLLWSNGATTSSIIINAAGTYSVNTTINGCTSANGFAMASPKTIPATPIVSVVDNCDGTSVLSTTASGNLLWSNGASTSSISVNAAGTYSVNTTINGCTSANGFATASPKTTPAAPIVNVVDNCDGTSALSTTATGNLLWSNGATTSSITVNTAGTYSVNITINACTSVNGFAMASPKTTPTAPIVSVVDNCDGTSILSTTATGNLLWSNSATTSSITVNTPGTYSVNTTINGCTSANGFATASPKTTPAAPIVNVVDNCDGTSTLSTSATGNLLWSNSATTSSITVNSAGTYSVNTTINACTSTNGFAMASPKTTPTAPIVSVVDNCNGTSILSTSASGNLLWSNGATTSSITVNTVGTYSVNTTINACTSANGFATASPKTTPAAPNVNVVDNCNGTSILSTSASGNLLWSNGATTSSITVNTAGTYSVNTTINVCTSANGFATANTQAAITLNLNPNTTICYGASTNLSCSGANSYIWSPSADLNTNLGNNVIASPLSNTVYTVQGTNLIGCTATAIISVQVGNPLSIGFTNIVSPTCFGNSNASFTAITYGVNPSYTYSISPNAVQLSPGNFSNLGSNTYQVNVTDANACTASSIITISQPSPLQIALMNNTSPLCNGGTNGSFSVIASGATAPYTFTSAPTLTQASIGSFSNAAANSYTLNVTDTKACTSSMIVALTQPSVIQPTVVKTNLTCNNSNNGSINIAGSGGVADYVYSLNNGTYSTVYTPSITYNNLAAGTYTLKLKDMNGCIKTTSTIISQPTAFSWTSVTKTNPTGSNANGSITAAAAGGTGTLKYSRNGINFFNSGIFNSLVAGTYTISVRDNRSCTATTLVNLNSSALFAALSATIALSSKCDGNALSFDFSSKSDKLIQELSLEESLDGSNFNQIAKIELNQGDNNSSSGNYVIDQYNKKAYYRASFVNQNKICIFSNVVSASSCNTLNSLIYPNPATNEIIISNGDLATYSILDNNGKLVLKGSTYNKVDIQALRPGIYYVLYNQLKQKFIKE
jgi:hypothetical protein